MPLSASDKRNKSASVAPHVKSPSVFSFTTDCPKLQENVKRKLAKSVRSVPQSFQLDPLCTSNEVRYQLRLLRLRSTFLAYSRISNVGRPKKVFAPETPDGTNKGGELRLFSYRSPPQ